MWTLLSIRGGGELLYEPLRGLTTKKTDEFVEQAHLYMGLYDYGCTHSKVLYIVKHGPFNR